MIAYIILCATLAIGALYVVVEDLIATKNKLNTKQ